MVKYLLLFHGYNQNKETMEKKINKLIPKKILNCYSVISVSGSYKIGENLNTFGWWRLETPMNFTKPGIYENYHKAIDNVKTQLSNINKTDSVSIIAFSQGTVIVEIMLALELFSFIPKKVLLVSPSGIMDKNIKVNKISNIEILATFGKLEKTFRICPEHYECWTAFKNYKTYVHDKGHVIPSRSCDKKVIFDFLFN